MLVQFSSVKTESITMFGDVATQLIRMLGASGKVPGALAADDISTAVARLKTTLAASQEPVSVESKSDEDDKDKEPPVALATRAQPLIDMLERASAAHAPVMWERLGS